MVREMPTRWIRVTAERREGLWGKQEVGAAYMSRKVVVLLSEFPSDV